MFILNSCFLRARFDQQLWSHVSLKDDETYLMAWNCIVQIENAIFGWVIGVANHSRVFCFVNHLLNKETISLFKDLNGVERVKNRYWNKSVGHQWRIVYRNSHISLSNLFLGWTIPFYTLLLFGDLQTTKFPFAILACYSSDFISNIIYYWGHHL